MSHDPILAKPCRAHEILGLGHHPECLKCRDGLVAFKQTSREPMPPGPDPLEFIDRMSNLNAFDGPALVLDTILAEGGELDFLLDQYAIAAHKDLAADKMEARVPVRAALHKAMREIVEGQKRAARVLVQPHLASTAAALDVAWEHGDTDGAHHKTWVIDQMVRALTGNGYAQWVAEKVADSGVWEEGIAP